MVIIDDRGDTNEQPEEYTFGIFGFVLSEAHARPGCTRHVVGDARAMDKLNTTRKHLHDEIDEFFNQRGSQSD
jgi:hypothetical protein